MNPRIEGKIAAIIDKHTVAINVGLKNGVYEGMQFKIVVEREQVKDPDTGEEIGVIRIPKATIKVIHVENKMSIAESLTYRTPGVMTATLLGAFPSLYGSEEKKVLPISEEDLEKVKAHDPTIKVGDKVIEVLRQTTIEPDTEAEEKEEATKKEEEPA